MRNPFRPAPVRAPGKHSREWFDLQKALIEVQQRANGFEQKATGLEAEAEQLKQRHARERAGWQEALQLAAAESRGVAEELEQVKAERDRLAGENQHLHALLDSDAGLPEHHVDAPIDQGCRDTPQAAEETVQATLADLEATGEHGLTEQLLAGLRQERRPRRPTLPTDVPPPDCEATAGLPLFGHSLPVRMVKPVVPTEVSRDAANAALASVADRLKPAEPEPADAMAAAP